MTPLRLRMINEFSRGYCFNEQMSELHTQHRHTQGFTIIEISIVLVIIGLVIGGILVGRDLIEAAKVRAAATQIEQLKTSVNTFRLKFGFLPGDIPADNAQAFGLRYSRNAARGLGDGDGTYKCNPSIYCGAGQNYGWVTHEMAFFFMQLSDAKLVAGEFNWFNSGYNGQTYGGPLLTNLTVGTDFPAFKLKSSMGILPFSSRIFGSNWFITTCGTRAPGYQTWVDQNCTFFTDANGSTATRDNMLTPAQAFTIDSKMDDGVPGTGNVRAVKVAGQTFDGTWDATMLVDNVASRCVITTASTLYNITATTPYCSLIFKM